MDKTKDTLLIKYGVTNVSKLEEFVHISRPDKFSPIYHEFIELINFKVGQFAKILTDHNIKFSSNEFINSHLYRIYIIDKDVLLDFEFYPVPNFNYNYIRVRYDQDMKLLYKMLFPSVILEPETLEVWKLTQRADNKFLRDIGASPIYHKDVLRLGIVNKGCILQTMVIRYDKKDGYNKLISDVTTPGVRINLGTMWLLRYFKEMFDINDIRVVSDLDNSYKEITYHLMGMKLLSHDSKKKIWWSPNGCKWHIKKEHTEEYVPYYFTEKRVWVY